MQPTVRRRPTFTAERRLTALCETCGFRPPRRADAAAAISQLATLWRGAVNIGGGDVHERVAYNRDEIHAVSNRVERLLAQPGATLSPIQISRPTAASGSFGPEVLVMLLERAVRRLAVLTARLRGEQWDIRGRIDRSEVSISELVAVPFHRAHRELWSWAAGSESSVVVFLEEARHLRGPAGSTPRRPRPHRGPPLASDLAERERRTRNARLALARPERAGAETTPSR